MENKKIEVTPELEELLAQIIKLRQDALSQDEAVTAKAALRSLGLAYRSLTDYLELAIEQAK